MTFFFPEHFSIPPQDCEGERCRINKLFLTGHREVVAEDTASRCFMTKLTTGMAMQKGYANGYHTLQLGSLMCHNLPLSHWTGSANGFTKSSLDAGRGCV